MLNLPHFSNQTALLSKCTASDLPVEELKPLLFPLFEIVVFDPQKITFKTFSDVHRQFDKIGEFTENMNSQTGNRTPAAAVRAPNPNH